MFGELKSVTLYDDEEYALITFKDFISAFFAQQSFNNHYLSKYNAILVVKWMPKVPIDDKSGSSMVFSEDAKNPGSQIGKEIGPLSSGGEP